MKPDSAIAFVSIKPKYAERILSGKKRHEFRRVPMRRDVEHIVIYSSSPQKRIVAIATVKEVRTAAPSVLWDETKAHAGIVRKEFREYFSGARRGFAISLEEITPLPVALDPGRIRDRFTIPQSFSYVDSDFFRQVLEKGKIGAGQE